MRHTYTMATIIEKRMAAAMAVATAAAEGSGAWAGSVRSSTPAPNRRGQGALCPLRRKERPPSPHAARVATAARAFTTNTAVSCRGDCSGEGALCTCRTADDDLVVGEGGNGGGGEGGHGGVPATMCGHVLADHVRSFEPDNPASSRAASFEPRAVSFEPNALRLHAM